jgi:hypothetical protein
MVVLAAGQRTIASMLWARKPQPSPAAAPSELPSASVESQAPCNVPDQVFPANAPAKADASCNVPDQAFPANAPVEALAASLTEINIVPDQPSPPVSATAEPPAPAAVPPPELKPLRSIDSLTEEELARTWPLNEFLAAKRIALARTFNHIVRTELQRDISEIENQIVAMINNFQ